MKITVKTIGIPLTSELKKYIENALGKLDKVVATFGSVAEAWVEVGRVSAHHRKGQVWKAVVDLRLPRKVLRAEETGNNLFFLINAARKAKEN